MVDPMLLNAVALELVPSTYWVNFHFVELSCESAASLFLGVNSVTCPCPIGSLWHGLHLLPVAEMQYSAETKLKPPSMSAESPEQLPSLCCSFALVLCRKEVSQ